MVGRVHRSGQTGGHKPFFRRVPQQSRWLPRLDRPQLINIVVGGKTPVLDREELADLGYGLVLYANTALQGALLGMQKALGSLKATGRMDEDSGLVASFDERQRLVDKARYDELAARYAS